MAIQAAAAVVVHEFIFDIPGEAPWQKERLCVLSF